MAMSSRFSLIHSEFNEFLFAAVGEEKNGSELTVLSALARLGVDPWGEAARLADLPKEAAARALGAIIAALPEGDWKVSDARTIAARLVDRLPRRGGAAADASPQSTGRADQIVKARTAIWLLAGVLAASVLFGLWHQANDHAVEPASGAVSSSQSEPGNGAPIAH